MIRFKLIEYKKCRKCCGLDFEYLDGKKDIKCVYCGRVYDTSNDLFVSGHEHNTFIEINNEKIKG